MLRNPFWETSLSLGSSLVSKQNVWQQIENIIYNFKKEKKPGGESYFSVHQFLGPLFIMYSLVTNSSRTVYIKICSASQGACWVSMEWSAQHTRSNLAMAWVQVKLCIHALPRGFRWGSAWAPSSAPWANRSHVSESSTELSDACFSQTLLFV